MASRELSILVTAKNMASKVLGTVKGDVNSLDATARRAGSNMGRNIGIGVAAVGAGLSVQVKAGVDSLVELERVNNLTAAALESTGNVAAQSAEGIRARSEAMETMSGVDDKVIQNAQNLLLTFTNVRKDAFEPTMEAALNLNAALGGGDEGLQGTLMQVAKAMNDPIKGMTALRRSGVSFTQEQVDQVKAMVEANDLMGAQAIILGELETQFGGAAAAANQGVGASQKRFSDAIEDMQMALATGFLPIIEKVSGYLQTLVANPAFLKGVEEFGGAMAGALEAGVDFAASVPWAQVGAALQTMGTGARMAMDAFLGAPPWLQTAILTGWGLNKLTGGGLGSIVGALGSGLVKGVLGMNAGVVNINAATVNGGGGLPAGGKGGAGLLGLLGVAGLAGAGLAGITALGTEVNRNANPTGFSFNELAGQKRVSRVQVEGDLLTLSAETGRSVTNLQAEMIPLLSDGNSTWSEVLAAVRSGSSNTTAAADRAAAAARDAIPWQVRNVQEIQNFNQSEGQRFARLGSLTAGQKEAIHALNASEGARAATQTGLLASINAKKTSVTAVINTSVNVSLQQWQRAQISSIRANSNSGGFI